jgi:mannosyl-oligosaccharide alpha-1,2-mannosidase
MSLTPRQFYEYLLKMWLLTGHRAEFYGALYRNASEGVLRHLLLRSSPSNLIYLAEAQSREPPMRHIHKMDHLVCFAAGMFALAANQSTPTLDFSAQLEPGAELARTCFEMYARMETGLAPELVRFEPGRDFYAPFDAHHYLLRPEAVEAFFVLHRVTRDRRWQDYGWQVFRAIEHHCRTPGGYVCLKIRLFSLLFFFPFSSLSRFPPLSSCVLFCC